MRDHRVGYEGPLWLQYETEERKPSQSDPAVTYVRVVPRRVEVWSCERCGCLVGNPRRHDEHHSSTEETP